MSKPAFRNNSVYLSDEVATYLKILAKAQVEGTEASLTMDQVADCKLRAVITEDYPQLVELYGSLDEAKQNAKQSYQNIETMMIKAVQP